MARQRFFYHMTTVGILAVMSFSAYAKSFCPAGDSIQYDKEKGQFVSQESPGWYSADMAALNPSPQGVFRSAVAMGERSDAVITCTYDVGKNSVSLTAKRHFELAAGWTAVKDSFYYCADIKTCVSKVK